MLYYAENIINLGDSMNIKKVLAVVLSTSMFLTTSVLAFSENIEKSKNDTATIEKEIVKQKASSGKCGENLTWTFDDEGTLTISGTGEMDLYYFYDIGRLGQTPWYGYNIKKVIIKNGVSSIGDCAFLDCTNLTSVTIPNSVTYIGNYAFLGCSSITTVTIPSGVRRIAEKTFASCFSLTSIKIPDSVKSIEESVFADCRSLTSITIPKNVSTIGYNVFDGCLKLTSITVDEENQAYSSDGYGVLFNKDKTMLIQYPIGNERTTYDIPDSVVNIGSDYGEYGAFASCSSLTSITIPNSVKNISTGTFSHCSGLTSVIIPDSMTSIGNALFYGCSGLTSVTIPDSITKIDDLAFSDCSSLTSVTIPASIKSIGNWAFDGCTSITDVFYKGNEEEWNQIYINNYNESLLDATIHFNYVASEVHDVPEFTKESNYVFDEVVEAVIAKPSSKAGESLDAFMDNIATDLAYVRVIDAQGVVQTEVTRLTTGYKVQLLDDSGNVSGEYSIVILGDTDRNGRYTVADVSKVQLAVVEKPAKGTIDFAEVDIDGNSKLSFADASALQSFVMNGTW